MQASEITYAMEKHLHLLVTKMAITRLLFYHKILKFQGSSLKILKNGKDCCLPLCGISLPILLPYLEDTCVPSCIPAYFRYNERESQKNREKIAEMQYWDHDLRRVVGGVVEEAAAVAAGFGGMPLVHLVIPPVSYTQRPAENVGVRQSDHRAALAVDGAVDADRPAVTGAYDHIAVSYTHLSCFSATDINLSNGIVDGCLFINIS